MSLVPVLMSSLDEICVAGNRLKPVLRNRGRAGDRYGDWLNRILQMSDIDIARERRPPAILLPYTLTV